MLSAASTTGAAATTPAAPPQQYVCANCGTSQHLPRPSPTGTLFQCGHCRMSSQGEVKVLYAKRIFAVEHATRPHPRALMLLLAPIVFANAAKLCDGALELLVGLVDACHAAAAAAQPPAEASVAEANGTTPAASKGRRVSIALSGGSTPKALYAALLSQHPTLATASCDYFFGDVRMVPHDSPDSNYAMAHAQLLHAVPETHVHNVTTVGCSADESAQAYEAVLRRELQVVDDGIGSGATWGCPVFDIVLLGVGPDGHTASLFPGTAAAAERVQCVVACMPNEGVSPYVERVTITSRVIQAAQHVVVLASGKEKHWVLQGLLADDADIAAGTAKAPVVRLLRECRGQVHLLVDSAMAEGGAV